MKTFFIFLVISCSCLPLAIACSCPHDYDSTPRSEAICFAYSSEPSIYKIRITTAQCKCLLGHQSQRFSCVDFSLSSSQNVVGRVRGLFECHGGGMPHLELYYTGCPSVIESAGGGSISITNTTANVENVTCNDAQYDIEKDGCELSYQPCYYSGIVEAVYKGNMQVGASLNVTGPDVTTTCGQYGRVLTVGDSYIAGIGGPCFKINPWSSYDSYTSDEIQLLEGLRDGEVTSCNRSTPTSSRSTPSSVSSIAISISRSRSTSGDTSSGSIRSTPTTAAGISQEDYIIIGLSSLLGVLLVVIILGFSITIIIIMRKKLASQRRAHRMTRGVVEIDVKDEEVKINDYEDITNDDKTIIFNKS